MLAIVAAGDPVYEPLGGVRPPGWGPIAFEGEVRLYYCLRIALKTSVTVPYLNFFQRSLCTDLLCSNLFVEPRHIPVVGALSSKL